MTVELPPPPMLSPEEVFEIEFLRTVWLKHGHDACRGVTQVLDDMMHHQAVHDMVHPENEPNTLLPLLAYPRNELNSAIDNLDACVNPSDPKAFSEVRARLEKLVSAYIRATGWMNSAMEVTPAYTPSRFNMPTWGKWHAQFAEDLETTIGNRSKYVGLRIVIPKDGRTIKAARP